MAIGREQIQAMFIGVPECNRVILARKLGPKLIAAISAVNKLEPTMATITPNDYDIMRAFNIPFTNIRAVLIAQDPYPGAGVADGLCFSTRKEETPSSMKNISKCIAKTCFQLPSNNLQSWADQGMLMLNCALTTRVGKSNVHTAWSPYTDAIIEEVSALPQKIVFILLGEFAKKKQSLIDDRHVTLTWCHPSPVNTKGNFADCTVFRRLNEIIIADGGIPFVFGPSSINPKGDIPPATTPQITYLFTDGGAKQNGNIGCKSSWGICVTTDFITLDHIDGGLTTGISEIKDNQLDASNNRGELAAILHALEYITGLPKLPPEIVIVSDSKYAMNSVSIWADSWAQDPKKLRTMKNLDIIYMANAYYRAIGSKTNISMKHVKAHRTGAAIPLIGSLEWKLWKGNDICDKKCTEVLNAVDP